MDFREIVQKAVLIFIDCETQKLSKTEISVKIDDIISHKIKMVIHANQTLRAAHASISRVLEQMINTNS